MTKFLEEDIAYQNNIINSITNMENLSFLKDPTFSMISVLIYFLALFIWYFLIYKQKRDGYVHFAKRVLLPITLIGGGLVYFIGYQTEENHSIIGNLFQAIFSTCRLFILGNDLVEIPLKIKENYSFHLWFSLFAASAVFTFVSLVLNLFAKDILVRRNIKKIKPKVNHFFFGMNQASFSLSKDLLKNKNELVVFVKDVYEEDYQSFYPNIIEDGAYVIKRESIWESIHLEKEEGIAHIYSKKKNHHKTADENGKLFCHLKVLEDKIKKTETHLYLLTEDEDWNIIMAHQLVQELQELPVKNMVRIHVRTNTESTFRQFFEWSRMDSNGIHISLHNHATIIARELIYRHNPIDSIDINTDKAIANSDFNVLVLGFGQIGGEVLKKLIEHGQFVGSEFHATVLDRCMGTLKGRFEYLYPGTVSNYDLNFIQTEVGHSDFYTIIKNKINSLNYIVITLGDDKLNMQTAMDILKMNRKNNHRFKLLVQISNNSFYKNLPKKILNNIIIFGRDNEVYTEKVIVQGELEYKGRKIHEVYSRQFNLTKTFDDLDLFKQLSNISSAEHLNTKLKLVGLTEEKVKSFPNKKAFLDSLTNIQKYNLAHGEHLRWNAFHFSNGWITLDAKNLPDKPVYNDRQNEQACEHACLVDWNSLIQLSKILNKDLQNLDMITIENIYDFIIAN